jgi:O-succinylbenzoate synthase
MQYKFSYLSYKREFKQPLKTSHGIWEFREGIIIKLEDNLGNFGLGEIAPLPWFGSETLEQALEFCQQLNGVVGDRTIKTISDHLPCCQFAFSSALSQFFSSSFPQVNQKNQEIKYCYLLPPKENCLQVNFQSLNYDTFKWKIGVNSVSKEIKFLEKLLELLPKNAKLRLDANGGLDIKQAKEWLNFADNLIPLNSSLKRENIIEFIEQPLKPKYFEEMLELSQQYKTNLALDESVANLTQLKDCYQKGWREIFVIKVGIIGSIFHLREFLLQNKLDLVFSSVLETKIGAKIALNIAEEFSQRAAGFGINHWFKEDFNCLDNLWQIY